MSPRALTVSLLLLILATVAMAQRMTIGSVTGTVRTTDDHAIADARVELRSSSTGQVIASTYTSFSGSFELHNITSGSYELLITSGLSQNSEMVQVHDDTVSTNVRLSAPSGNANAGDRSTVSVADMKVPDKARDAFKKAQKAVQKQDAAEARKQLQRALEIYPNYAGALTLRGLLTLDDNKPAEALTDLEAAVEADNNYALGYIVLGAAYNLLSRFDDAMRVLDRGTSLSPASWQGYFEMAKASLAKHDLAGALKHVNRAADLAPKEYAPVHLIRANIYLAQKNYAEAMSELEGYLEKNPNSPQSEQARKALEQVRAFVGK